ncbi:hypothetical protein BOTBODRAFT_152442 [Botryobasidium botryosum FD-172 SS1]|uniref:LYR motif-containing protein Cup1-like N-terminal domain-containing protein n=1 Tax=Botryobasidium botryosum (strain FD-172 SS1) TaxID=930990 RepID=A0A067MYY2_BOTB1|nr:hypothetical protein BOTBODRAFT_152442 [Botryobasidium botryosum FD-172 SS1]
MALSFGHRARTLSLYRSLLRQAGRLPHQYLSQFFRSRVRDDFRKNRIVPSRDGLLNTKLRRARKDLKLLTAASAGGIAPLNRVLSLAYGRTGKFRRELLTPILSDAPTLPPPRIIPAVERSRPPSYNPMIKALLASPHARIRKTLSSRKMATPPTLPERADPKSKDAQLLGPFSRRREVNIRWRYFTGEVAKVRPPLEIRLKEMMPGGELVERENDRESLIRLGLSPIGLEGTSAYRDLRVLAGEAISRPLKPRRQRKLHPEEAPSPSTQTPTTTSPLQRQPPRSARSLRNRYKLILAQLPILNYVYKPPPLGKGPPVGRFTVSKPPPVSTMRSVASVDDMVWAERAAAKDAIENAIAEEEERKRRQIREPGKDQKGARAGTVGTAKRRT